MEALRQLNVPARDLYLITGRTFSSSGLEAALLVRIGEQYYLLGARSNQVIEATRATAFTPIVTYGVGMTWAHGVPVSSVSVPSSTTSKFRSRFSALAPPSPDD